MGRFLQPRLCWWPLAIWIRTSPYPLPLPHRTLLHQQIKIVKIILSLWIIFIIKILLQLSPGALLYHCPLVQRSSSRTQACEAPAPATVSQSTHRSSSSSNSSSSHLWHSSSVSGKRREPFLFGLRITMFGFWLKPYKICRYISYQNS